MNIRRAVGIAAVSAGLAFAPSSALAAPTQVGVQSDHASFDVTFDATGVCGIQQAVSGHAVGTSTDIMRLNKSGFPLFFSNFVGTTTFTAGTRSATVRFAGPIRDVRVVDNGDGTITVTSASSGLISVISDGSGSVLLREVGRLVVDTVLDYNGTPSNADDDVFLSQTIVSTAGQGNPGTGGFCTTLTAALLG